MPSVAVASLCGGAFVRGERIAVDGKFEIGGADSRGGGGVRSLDGGVIVAAEVAGSARLGSSAVAGTSGAREGGAGGWPSVARPRARWPRRLGRGSGFFSSRASTIGVAGSRAAVRRGLVAIFPDGASVAGSFEAGASISGAGAIGGAGATSGDAVSRSASGTDVCGASGDGGASGAAVLVADAGGAGATRAGGSDSGNVVSDGGAAGESSEGGGGEAIGAAECVGDAVRF